MLIEVWVIQYLKDVLNVPVYASEPELPKSGAYIVIEKTGGGRENLIDSATIEIRSYDDSKYLASSLNEKVKNAMNSFIEEENISNCELNTDYNNPDLETKRQCYSSVWNITYMK